jgi:8-oxo-dGTP pyrophosphatase MutT (NUDIX family)
MKPIFKSRESKVHIIDGKEVWESRSCATGAIIFAVKGDDAYVLSEKRSENMPDGKGMWVVPSGYINYDENGWDAMRRECYEETSFDINMYKENLIFDNNQDSFYTHTEPSENRQNIVIWYCLIYDFSDSDLPLDIENYIDSEVDKVKWIDIKEVLSSKYNWAFEHDIRISTAIEKFMNYQTFIKFKQNEKTKNY